MQNLIPYNLNKLHEKEIILRQDAQAIIKKNQSMSLHLNVTERAMTMAKVVIECPIDEEDYKVIKMLSIRLFNAFGASLNLILSGYHQKGAMIMRDILETIFLMDFFQSDLSRIELWRNANDKQKRNDFSAFKIRDALDKRDGLTNKKRAQAYKILSELASHPTMGTQYMLKPELDGDILTGPFMGETILREGLEELGKLAVQAGEVMDCFLPDVYNPENTRTNFYKIKNLWIDTFLKKNKNSSKK